MNDWYICSIIMVLVICGGLGFFVVNDIVRNISRLHPFRKQRSELSVHSKIVIIMTIFLLTSGTLAIFFFEFDNTLFGLSALDKLLASVFQSVTTRTAGYNTIDIGGLRDVTLLIMIFLMFIGASPASTGGGVKTTTVAVLVLSVRSLLKSRDKVEIFKRTIPHEIVYKSIAIILFSGTFIFTIGILLVATQTGKFVDIIFEVFSAIGTVGLSTGVTGTLDAFGKVLVSLLMYVGRVGPLTMVLAMGEAPKIKIAYPTAKVNVG